MVKNKAAFCSFFSSGGLGKGPASVIQVVVVAVGGVLFGMATLVMWVHEALDAHTSGRKRADAGVWARARVIDG